LFQKSQAFSVLTNWHPVLLAGLVRAFDDIGLANADQAIHALGVFLFYASLFWALKKHLTNNVKFIAAILLTFSFYPFWFFLKPIWKDVYFVAFFIFSCTALMRIDAINLKNAKMLFVFFAASLLALLSRHNAAASIMVCILVWWAVFPAPVSKKLPSVKAGSFVLIFFTAIYGAKSLIETSMSVKSPGSMINFVLAFDSFGSLSKLNMSQRRAILQEFYDDDPEKLLRAVEGYKHTAPTDYLFWGVAPALEVDEQLNSTQNIDVFKEMLVKHPSAVFDFKADLILQSLGITRYDFIWTAPTGSNALPFNPLPELLEYFCPYVCSSEANIYGELNFYNFVNYIFGMTLVAASVMALLFFVNPTHPALKVAVTWMGFGVASLAPFFLLSQGAFYRYEAAAFVALFIAVVVAILALIPGPRVGRTKLASSD
tara:strand:+ start:14883 stop:16169 length:1287 start_codon:yes stop_codon:yes gene_type:complete